MAMSSLRSTSSALRSTNGQDPEKSVEGMDVDVGRSFSHPTGGDDVANSNGVEPSENEGDGSGQGRVSTTKDTHVDTTASGADVSLVFPPTTTTTTNPGTFANPDSLNAANPSDPTGASDSATTDKAAPAGQESTSGDSGLSFQQQQPSYTTQNVDQSMSSRLTLRPVEGEQNWRV
ncbi:hypothetical protein BT96DRAFT_1000978 [Gymnopus androsaceus JB14]|uniref:Uncharacterized protein n=1 Tax=Gymnopus androsaceus JB14 TaxID=1447944 RepID=A0A6A4H258_9AGAR|nr:hypothetical protein BT96DRAFT_1000978 [Gymnopus androsaceus JB14]